MRKLSLLILCFVASAQASYVAGPSLNGGPAAPQAVTAAGGISLTAISPMNFIWVVGSPGAVVVTKTPSITPCTKSGQILVVAMTDDTKTVALQDEASLAGSGVELNGELVGKNWSMMMLSCNKTAGKWQEISRR